MFQKGAEAASCSLRLSWASDLTGPSLGTHSTVHWAPASCSLIRPRWDLAGSWPNLHEPLGHPPCLPPGAGTKGNCANIAQCPAARVSGVGPLSRCKRKLSENANRQVGREQRRPGMQPECLPGRSVSPCQLNTGQPESMLSIQPERCYEVVGDVRGMLIRNKCRERRAGGCLLWDAPTPSLVFPAGVRSQSSSGPPDLELEPLACHPSLHPPCPPRHVG
jgi:hypothetical protein